MGGYGSGERWGAKATTDHALRLDVRWLARQGFFQPNTTSWMPVSWTCNGRPSGDIQARYDDRQPDELILTYRTRARGETDWTDVREVIRLERTPCHYGGERVWCRCPRCGSRRAVLYSLYGRFLCVRCNDLAYSWTCSIGSTDAVRRSPTGWAPSGNGCSRGSSGQRSRQACTDGPIDGWFRSGGRSRLPRMPTIPLASCD